MNDNTPSKLVPELHCPDCKKPMRIRTLSPMLNDLWDLSFECEQCGKVSGVVHKPEDGQDRRMRAGKALRTAAKSCGADL